MNWSVARPGARAACAAALLAVASACDGDPGRPGGDFPAATVMNGDTIGRQEPIRVVFQGKLAQATALDRANFVLTNLCNGLRVEGSVRLGPGPDADTLSFSPAQALPFLTRLQGRIQNLLTESGTAQAQPIIFTRITQAPPVNDVTWEQLGSLTIDALTGVGFVNRTNGFFTVVSGGVYRTTDGGQNFIARYQSQNVSFVQGLHAFADTLYFTATLSTALGNRRALFRSINAGLTFDTVASVLQTLYTMDLKRGEDGRVGGVFGGQFADPAAYRFDAPSTITPATLPVTGTDLVLSQLAVSPDLANAVAVFTGAPLGPFAQQGRLARSTDGGRTYTLVTLPQGVFALRGAGFADNTTAIVLGDSSVILRVDVTDGTITKLGAAAGIPQSLRDPETGVLTTYSFSKARFVRDETVGWAIGSLTRSRPGQTDVNGGVILMSRDGGATWRRQAVRNAPNNGLDFAPLTDIHALARDFSVIGGASGFIAARRSDPQGGAQACSFTSL